MTLRLRHRLAAAVAVLPLLVTGCGGESAGDDSGEAADAGFNDADVAFATEMIQHHAQALSMVDLTLGRELTPETGELMEEIRAAQAPEIEQMVDLLQEWGQPVPETVRDHANAHGGHGDDDGTGGTGEGEGTGHDMAEMPGMLSDAQMAELADAPPAEFEDLLLTLMIEHHEGAVVMAEEELAEGANAEAQALARDIVRTQTAEIETMEQLLAG